MNNKTKYDFKKIEAKWRQYWDKHPELYQASKFSESNLQFSKKQKKYVLVEFPYPSGSGLHIGHTFSFTGGDIYARFKRMQGFDVMFPMGWDAFGLPTENYAIKVKRPPQEITKENTDMFRRQMKDLAYSFDWDREINSTDPKYYKWTQWIFIKLFEKGLAYKKEMPINWCPSCKIGLANEEVLPAGRHESIGKCERCGAEVSRRNISQWVVKITDYADRLIDGLEKTDFEEKVKMAQINWIGKSEGAKIKFEILNSKLETNSETQNSKFKTESLEVFTTRPDTLYGATFMVVAPEHKIVQEILNSKSETLNSKEIKEYVKKARGKSDIERTELSKEKTGVFSGMYAINPVNDKKIPIWISDFVLASYGTGAIMAVPAHDERDFDFAKKFGLEIIPVIEPSTDWDFESWAYTDVDSGKMINSPKWDGMKPARAIKTAIEFLDKEGMGEKASSYHLRDWIFSRQHYWGEPIPMVNCPEHGWVPVPIEQLPIELPKVEAYEPTDTGESPLAKMTDWVETTCPVCEGPAKRETDTMPNWAGSDWYFLAYIFADKLGKETKGNIFEDNIELLEKWMPVDVYIGGDEHNTLHLLYSRFIYQFLYDLGVVPEGILEPYYKRISHGVILGPDGSRMSKSRENVIVPGDITPRFGVDVVRTYLMFMGPFDNTMSWNEKTLVGVKRFLDKFWEFTNFQFSIFNQDNDKTDSSDQVKVIINKLIEGVTGDLESFKYNTAIAKMMEALNSLRAGKYKLVGGDLKSFIRLLAPFAPYMTEELYSRISDEGEVSVHVSLWPKADDKYLVDDKVTIPVAINGKRRSQIEVSSQQVGNETEVLKLAMKDEGIAKWIETKEVVRKIYIPGKMVNLVI